MGRSVRWLSQRLRPVRIAHQPDFKPCPLRRRGASPPNRIDVSAHVRSRRHADRQQCLLRLGERCVALGVRRDGTTLPTSSRRRIDEQARRVAVGIPFDLAADRVLRGDVIPAAFIAALLTTIAWPSTRSSTTGRSATTASRSAAVGKRLSAHSSWFQPSPMIHVSLRVARRHRREAAAAGRRASWFR